MLDRGLTEPPRQRDTRPARRARHDGPEGTCSRRLRSRHRVTRAARSPRWRCTRSSTRLRTCARRTRAGPTATGSSSPTGTRRPGSTRRSPKRASFPPRSSSRTSARQAASSRGTSSARSPASSGRPGNLGQGLSAGVGLALGARLTGASWHTFVAMSDGEQHKGQVAEARRLAVKESLGNLTVVIDCNRIQISGHTDEVMPVHISADWAADGWRVVECDGHDLAALHEALRDAVRRRRSRRWWWRARSSARASRSWRTCPSSTAED